MGPSETKDEPCLSCYLVQKLRSVMLSSFLLTAVAPCLRELRIGPTDWHDTKAVFVGRPKQPNAHPSLSGVKLAVRPTARPRLDKGTRDFPDSHRGNNLLC